MSEENIRITEDKERLYDNVIDLEIESINNKKLLKLKNTILVFTSIILLYYSIFLILWIINLFNENFQKECLKFALKNVLLNLFSYIISFAMIFTIWIWIFKNYIDKLIFTIKIFYFYIVWKLIIDIVNILIMKNNIKCSNIFFLSEINFLKKFKESHLLVYCFIEILGNLILSLMVNIYLIKYNYDYKLK